MVNKYLRMQISLRERLDDCYKKVTEHKRQMDEMIEKRSKYQNERLVNGIMENSVLTVHVVEARNLLPMDMEGTSDPYVIMTIEGQRIQTSVKSSDLNPVWNESFTFDIDTGREPLQIEVMDKDTFGADDFEGECQISL